MTIDLDWFLKEPASTDPSSPVYVKPINRPGAAIGDVLLGCGIVAPFERDGKGDFRNGCGQILVRASVERILGIVCMSDTTHGDLEWAPEFGSLIHRVKHANANDGTSDLARYYVIDALRIWEPRIDVHDARVDYIERNDPGSSPGMSCEIHLLYDIIGQRRGTGVLVPGVNQLVVLNNGFQ